MISEEQIRSVAGAEVRDRDGQKIGTAGQLYVDADSGQPAWLSVNTGLFGMKESLAPLHDAQYTDGRVQLAHEKDIVKKAPNIDVDADEPLSSEEVQRLYQHYSITPGASGRGMTGGGMTGGGGYTTDEYQSGQSGYRAGTSGSSDDAMTRSEERLNVGTQMENAGTARLRKYVVTENVQTTVPVRREEAVLEREPITDANRDHALAGPEITESEHEVTLRAERPVVEKETVPVEQVRLGTQTRTDQETVGGEVRKERIEADLPTEGRQRLD